MRERWLSRRAFALHLFLLLFVPACGGAAWWQITRATDGNGLSYLYAVEWPIFAILGVYFWWMFIHTDYDTVGLKGMRKLAANRAAAAAAGAAAADAVATVTTAQLSVPTPAQRDVDADPELAAYNARLAALSNQGGKTWRSPERTVVRRNT